MSNYPPQPGYGPPPPGYGRPPRNATRGNANGMIAAVVAGVVIVVGVITTVLLVTGDGNKQPVAASGHPTGSNLPSGSHLPSGSRLPSGSGLPSGSTRGLPTDGLPTNGVPPASSDLTGATSSGTLYFQYLSENLYYTSRGKWCDEDQFPLTQNDVAAVTLGYAIGTASGSGSGATMQGRIGLDDGRVGTLTISLRPMYTGSSYWCITAQSNLS